MLMPIKLQRPGFTETSLIFVDFLRRAGAEISPEILAFEDRFINWLYSTAGWYDRSVAGSYFDFKPDEIRQSKVFQEWVRTYQESLFQSTFLIPFIPPDTPLKESWGEKFFTSFQSQNINYPQFRGFWYPNLKSLSPLYSLIENKRVLVVNSLTEIILRQLESKQLWVAWPQFPTLTDLKVVKTPYTFFNQGEHQNSLETITSIMEQIRSAQPFDIALVGFGSYGCILVDKITKELGRNAVTLGSGLTHLFGINAQAEPAPGWITEIPAEYRPWNFEKIERGRYWIKIKKQR